MRGVIVFTLLFLTSCLKPKGKDYFELPELKKIVKLSLIKPPPAVISFTPVYILGTNDSISESNFLKLQEVYNALYKNEYLAVHDFLFDALNQKIKIDTRDPLTYWYYSKTFLIEPDIMALYNAKGINGLMEKHCLNYNGFYTLNREALKLNEINSITYYFFLNQYIRVDDDYNATINFKKLTSLLN